MFSTIPEYPWAHEDGRMCQGAPNGAALDRVTECFEKKLKIKSLMLGPQVAVAQTFSDTWGGGSNSSHLSINNRRTLPASRTLYPQYDVLPPFLIGKNATATPRNAWDQNVSFSTYSKGPTLKICGSNSTLKTCGPNPKDLV